jgi:alpha-tubulin suppressor-like RCC1 family protein
MRISLSLLIALFMLAGCNSTIGTVSLKNGILNSNSFLTRLTPTFSVSDVSEGNGFAVTFSLPADLSASTDFDWVITGDDVPGDFPVASGRISLSAGDNSGVIVIPTNENLIYDLNRNYELSIRADVVDALGTVDDFRVMDDESVPEIQFSAASQNVNENAVLPTATLTLSPASKFPISVNFTVSGTASGLAVDHSLLNGTVNFAAGATNASIALAVVDDVIAESAETIILSLGTITGSATLGSESVHTATIVDNENVNLSISDVTVSEGGVATFTVSISSANAVDVFFDWATANGSGNSVDDYIADSGTGASITAGNLSTTISVNTRTDALICEANKTFSVIISNVINSAVADNTGVGTITDPDAPAMAFTLGTSSSAEGTATDTTVNVEASLSAVCASRAITFDVASSAGTATSGTDFTAIPTTSFSIAAGSTTVNVPVTIRRDALFEYNETLLLTMSNPAGATLGGQATHTLTITNDDAKPTISIADLSFTEGDGGGTQNATITVTQSALSGVATEVNYATSNDTALQPADYTSASGTLTIPAGQLTGTFSVPVVRDAMDEFDEIVNLTLSGGNGNYEATGSDLAGVLTIVDDDLPPVITLTAGAAVTEGAGLSFTASLSAVSGKNITFDFTSSDGTANQPGDYTAVSSSHTINAGSASQVISVTTIDDAVNCETPETVNGTLSSLVNATAGTITRQGTINDNDIPVLSLNAASVTEGGTAMVTMTSSLSCPVTTITATYATFSNTAIEAQDYTHAEGTFTILPNTLTSNTMTVTTLDDDIPELPEKMFVGFGNNNVGSLDSAAVIEILDNEVTVAPAKVAVSFRNSCALTNQGDFKCWGAFFQGMINQQMVLGDAANETQTLMVPVPIPGPYSKLSIGLTHACVLLSTGGVRCWGTNDWSQLGNGSNQPVITPAQISSLSDIGFGAGRTATDICSGPDFNCALLDNQTVKCWGRFVHNGTANIIGDSPGEVATAPVVNIGGQSAATLSCGASHACVVTTSGEVRCWGNNDHGQLGNNSTIASATGGATAINVGTGLTAISVAAGVNHTCAILRNGILEDKVKCWGYNNQGQLGLANTETIGNGLDPLGDPADEMGDNLSFLDFGAIPNATEIYAGNDVSCAGFADGSYRCWGRGNTHGSGWEILGDQPGELALLSPLNFGANTQILGLSHKIYGFCAKVQNTLNSEVSVRCFGNNNNSVLGRNQSFLTTNAVTLASSATAVAFDPAFTVTGLPVGYGGNEFSCAIGTVGLNQQIRCWGSNKSGQLGGPNISFGDEVSDMGAALPLIDPGLDGVDPVEIVDVALGFEHNCILSSLGKIKCIGRNFQGELGTGTSAWGDAWGDDVQASGIPETLANQSFVNLPRPAVGVFAGGNMTCALTDKFDLYCWGSQTGLSSSSSSNTPVLIDLGTNNKAVSVAMGSDHICAVLGSQQVKCWGRNNGGLLGLGLASTVTVGFNPGEIAAAPTLNFGMAGGVPRRVKSVFAGQVLFSQSCAVFHDDTAMCWGYNGYGPVGINSSDPQGDDTSPLSSGILVQLAEPLHSFIPGIWTNCSISKDFRFKCWGGVFEGEGALGSTYTIGHSAFYPISGVAATDFGDDGVNPYKLWNWSGSGYGSHYCAIIPPGEVKCWGRNQFGYLGLGDEMTKGDSPGETPRDLPAVDVF